MAPPNHPVGLGTVTRTAADNPLSLTSGAACPADPVTDLPHDDDGPYSIPSSLGEDTPDSLHDYGDQVIT